jgi:glucans biosynthesis protein
MNFRRSGILVSACLVLGCASTRGAEKLFDFDVLRYRAKLLAAKPYVARPTRVPEKLLRLTYDQHRDIRFNPTQSWGRRDGLPFQLQFFHPGFIFNKTVQISELKDGDETPIPFSPQLFDYGRNDIGQIPESMGFSGVRVLYPLNRAGDELGAFQGASYFRLLCEKAVYGLSARGLAINTGDPAGEEFPVFEEFWVQRMAPGATEMVLFALLDSPSITGAYRFVIKPGADTVAQVKSVLYARKPIKTLGLAALTIAKVIGVKRTLQRMGRNFKQATNSLEAEVTELGPKAVRIRTFTAERYLPRSADRSTLVTEYRKGLLEQTLVLIGAQGTVTIEEHHPERQDVTFRIEWQ